MHTTLLEGNMTYLPLFSLSYEVAEINICIFDQDLKIRRKVQTPYIFIGGSHLFLLNLASSLWMRSSSAFQYDIMYWSNIRHVLKTFPKATKIEISINEYVSF